MPVIWIPALLRTLTEGHETVHVSGGTVGEVIDALDARYPGLKARLCDVNGLKPGVAVAIDATLVRGGLSEIVNEASEVHFLPALSGGAQAPRRALP
jgi:molybdopterin converting factor small subunit